MNSRAEGAGAADRVLNNFLIRQHEEGLALARSSDLLDLQPLDGPATRRYIATFTCRGLVKGQDGKPAVAERFGIGIRFPDDYLRRADTFQVLTILGPSNIFHPNISERAPFICIGWLKPGTSLIDILFQCFEIITYNKLNMVEKEALNAEACNWARHNQGFLPIDTRPLKRPDSKQRLPAQQRLHSLRRPSPEPGRAVARGGKERS